MNVKELIEANNRKRELLTEENETYYGDLLVYIRLKFSISEQQSEEILMELLDHLLDGQEAGKTAKEIFGDDPKGFADDIIEQLPKEQKRKFVPFVLGIIANILGWVLLIRGVLFLVLPQFIEVNTDVYPISVVIVGLMIAVFVIATIVYILRIIERSLFNEDRKNLKDTIKVGLFGGLGMALVLLCAKFFPEIGPSFDFSWWASLLVGAVLLICKKMNKG